MGVCNYCSQSTKYNWPMCSDCYEKYQQLKTQFEKELKHDEYNEEAMNKRNELFKQIISTQNNNQENQLILKALYESTDNSIEFCDLYYYDLEIFNYIQLNNLFHIDDIIYNKINVPEGKIIKIGLSYTTIEDKNSTIQIGNNNLLKYYHTYSIETNQIKNPNPLLNQGEIKCKDGHYVRSRAEKIIDDWLFDHNILHCYEMFYDFPNCEESHYCDWYIPKKDLYIEYWGYDNNDRYQYNKQEKQRLCKLNNYKLLELEKNDINNIDIILREKLQQFK